MKTQHGKLIIVIAIGLLFSLTAAHAQTINFSDLTRQQSGESHRNSSSNEDITRNGDARSIPAGDTLTLMDEKGPGIITHFWNTVGSHDIFYPRSLVLRIYYDGMEKPSVEAPLGDFFGVGHGMHKNFSSAPVTVSSRGRSRVCYWQMPFKESIKITVTNDNPDVEVDSFYYYINWKKVDSLPNDTVYFHARYRQETPAKPGNYTILDTKGHGHYVGTVLSNFQMETGWFGEGDDFFYIDGATVPQLRGTGTEDYFNDAWGFREFDTPFHGVTLYEGVVTGDRVSAYRWHIQDPILFEKSLHLEIEHKGSIFDDQAPITGFEVGGFIERHDWVSSVAFWYQFPPVTANEPFPAWEERVVPHTLIMAKQMEFRAEPPLLVLPDDLMVAYLPTEVPGQIEFDFNIPEDGRYRVDGIFMFSLLSGVYQIYMNEKKVGQPVDFGVIGMDPQWVALDTYNLKKGKQTVKFVGLDQQSASSRNLAPAQNGIFFIGLNLTRLDTMDGYLKALREQRPK